MRSCANKFTAVSSHLRCVLNLSPWLTGTVGVDGVPQAFADLAEPDHHAEILVVPGT